MKCVIVCKHLQLEWILEGSTMIWRTLGCVGFFSPWCTMLPRKQEGFIFPPSVITTKNETWPPRFPMWSLGRGSGPRQRPVGWDLRGLWQTPSTRGQCALTPSTFMSKTVLFDWSSPKSQAPKQRTTRAPINLKYGVQRKIRQHTWTCLEQIFIRTTLHHSKSWSLPRKRAHYCIWRSVS